MTDFSRRRNSLLEAPEFEVSGRNAIMDDQRTPRSKTPRGHSSSDCKEFHLPSKVALGGLTTSQNGAILRVAVRLGEAGVASRPHAIDAVVWHSLAELFPTEIEARATVDAFGGGLVLERIIPCADFG